MIKCALLLLSCLTIFAQRTPLSVNGTVVNNPNFTNTASVTWSVTGPNIRGTASAGSDSFWTNSSVASGSIQPVGGGNVYMPGTLAVVGQLTNDALQASQLVYAGPDKVLSSVSPGNSGDVLTSSGPGIAPSFLPNAAVPTSRTITAGNGMSGGGDLSANRTLTWGPSTWTDNTVSFGDSSESSIAWTFNLSGATDPVITAANNSLSLNVPLLLSAGTAASPSIAGSVSSGRGFRWTSGAMIFSDVSADIWSSAASSIIMRNNGQFAWAATTDPATTPDTILGRDSAGVAKVTSNGTALAGFKAGTLTLTPAAADTTAKAISGGSTTGSGTTSGETFAWTWNTSGNVTGKLNNIVNTASGASSLYEDWQIGGASVASISRSGSFTTAGNVTASGFVAAGNANFIGWGDARITRENAAIFQLGLDAASATAQTLKAHDGSGTDIPGANLIAAAGQGTGTGRGGALIGKTSPSGSTGSSANAYSERYHFPSKAVTLTSATATTVATIACASGKFVGGSCVVTVFATDGTDHQARTLRFSFSAVNKAGTVTAGIDTPDESIAASSGTLTAAITAVANGNAVDLKVNADSSLTETTLSATVSLPAINGNDTAAVTEI